MSESTATGLKAAWQVQGHKQLNPMFRLAIQTGSPVAILARLRLGDSVHSRDTQGRTPLMLAALRGHLEACSVLLDNEANALAVDHDNATALDLALQAGKLAVVEKLRQFSTTAAANVLPAEQGNGKDRRGIERNYWEPESREPIPEHDETCVAQSAQLQDLLRVHGAVNQDVDWGDVDLQLPVAAGQGVDLEHRLPLAIKLKSLVPDAQSAGKQIRQAKLKIPKATLTSQPTKPNELASTIALRTFRAVFQALKLLASSDLQRSVSVSLDVPSFQREFAYRWFQAYSTVDPHGIFTSIEHAELQRVSAELRQAVRQLGREKVDIELLLIDAAWQNVIHVATSALKCLTEK